MRHVAQNKKPFVPPWACLVLFGAPWDALGFFLAPLGSPLDPLRAHFQQSLKELEIKVVATTRLGDNGYAVVDYQGSIDSIVEMLGHYWDITWEEFFIMMYDDELELTEVNK